MSRCLRRSTALVTNIDFEAWSDYLGDLPLAMAFLDRVVDEAIVLKLPSKFYRAHRARRLADAMRDFGVARAQVERYRLDIRSKAQEVLELIKRGTTRARNSIFCVSSPPVAMPTWPASAP